MLTILTGTEAVGRPIIAKKLTEVLNSFGQYPVDGYSVNFTNNGCTITNPAGTVVYGPATTSTNETHALILNPADGSPNEAGQALLEKIFSIQQSLKNTFNQCQVGNIFTAPGVDHGVRSIEDVNINYQLIISAIINLYYKRKY